ncbi:MAG: CDP-alcohol phosphatidyltransferase family protein [Candidatus Saccharimonadales bacterium]
MMLPLHIPKGCPDWENTPVSKRNRWQIIAASTKGVVTPANIISVAGGILVISGLFKFTDEITLTGLCMVTIGRTADAVDGYVADLTGTKSPFGELVDTSIDKLVAALAIIILYTDQLLPIIFLVVIGLHTILNSSLSLFGRSRKIIIHASFTGKLATAMLWIIIITYITHSYFGAYDRSALLTTMLFGLSWAAFISFVILGTQSSMSYIRQLTK